jgi:spermidine synthase
LWPLYAVTLVLAMCSLLYELVLAQTLSALLGNTVLRYSITIGCYLGALGVGSLLCKPDAPDRDPRIRLVRVEVALCIVGASAVPCFFYFDGIQRYLYFGEGAWAGESYAPILFLVATHVFIVAIGVLSGFELPLLLSLGERRRRGSTPRVLGVDYLGSLVGAVVFPLVLLPKLGLIATAFSVALLNGVAGAILAFWFRLRRWTIAAGLAVAILLSVVGLAASSAIEQRFLKSFYYETDLQDPISLTLPEDIPPVEHHRSSYQSIDMFAYADAEQWQTDIFMPRNDPDDLWMYIDGEFQFFSAIEAAYHEWFVHLPVQQLQHVPRRVLVLGGGDAMAVRELLRYEDVEEVVQVELDPMMIELSRTHPLLTKLNDPAHRDPRHRLIADDAFHWLRSNHDEFELILVDMPYPKDHNLSNVYSREFYIEVHKHLTDDGYLGLDAPSGDCHEGAYWPMYSATLRAAGFQTVQQYGSFLAPWARRPQSIIDAADRVVVQDDDGTERVLTGADATEWWQDRVQIALDEMPVNEFILASPAEVPIVTTWTELDVPLRAFGPALLPEAFAVDCEVSTDERHINSIFRPTIPTPELLSLRG